MAINERLAYLIRQQMVQAIEDLEQSHAAGAINTFTLKNVYEVALLLHHSDIEERARRLLMALPDEAFLVGAITNMVVEPETVRRLRSLPPRDKIEKNHPLCGSKTRCRNCGERPTKILTSP